MSKIEQSIRSAKELSGVANYEEAANQQRANKRRARRRHISSENIGELWINTLRVLPSLTDETEESR